MTDSTGHEPTIRGIFSDVLEAFRKPKTEPEEDWSEVIEAFAPINTLADIMGWPESWIVCAHCGAQSWRTPPHLFDPCPLVVEAAQAQGMKVDAERSTAIRLGVSLEEQALALREWVDSQLGRDDEE